MNAKPLTILLAEDDPGDRIPVADLLRKQGHQVAEVVNPQQAIDCLETDWQEIDVIVLDLVMPEDNPSGGQEVLEYMRKNDILIPVILATAWGYNGPAEEARRVYPEAVKQILTKTFVAEELHGVILSVVKEHQQAKRGARAK